MNYPQIKPTLNLDFSNTKTLDPRINFRRGTPGAYYDGKTYAKAEENLLSYSEDFSNAYWNKTRIDTPTSGQSSPDGQSTAYLLTQTENATGGAIYVAGWSGQVGKKYTSSVYAKAGTSGFLVIAEEVSRDDPAGSGAFTYFDLSNDGEVVLNHENHIASIQNVGNQWYRCSITFTAHISSDLISLFYLSDSLGQSTISAPQDVPANSTIYLWGAQLEQRDSLTSYTPTSGNPITKYQPQLMFASPDQPRFDHDPITGESKGLLIEESRTNLIEYSEDFSNWSIYNGPLEVTHNTVIAPDGTLAATIIKDISTGSYSGIYESLDINSGDYTSSVFIKQGSSATSSIWIALTEAGMVKQETITWTAGVPTASSIQFIDMGNGWYRAYVTVTSTTSQSMIMYLLPCGFNATYTGTTVFWGAQLEGGSFPTSYIKTSGASATRSADNASITGENFSSWYRQDEGSFEVDFKSNSPINKWVYIFSLTQNGDYTVNNLALRHPINEETVACRFLVNGSAQFEAGKIDQSYDHLGFSKAVIAYNNQDISVGTTSEFLTQATSIGPNNLNQINLFDINSTSESAYSNCGHIKKLSYYPQRLTNEQLQQLTK